MRPQGRVTPEGDMDIGIIGSATVAQTVGGKLLDLGHTVTISSRDTSRSKDRGEMGTLPSADRWVAEQRAEGADAAAGSFAEAAAAGELVINATTGAGSLEALELAGASNLRGKILIDLSNPLDFSKGMPPSLFVCNTDSLGEQIQAALPETRVVKTLNTVSAGVMVDPLQLGEPTTIFVAGDDGDAKAWVTRHVLREWFGWEHVVDLGDITASRGVGDVPADLAADVGGVGRRRAQYQARDGVAGAGRRAVRRGSAAPRRPPPAAARVRPRASCPPRSPPAGTDPTEPSTHPATRRRLRSSSTEPPLPRGCRAPQARR